MSRLSTVVVVNADSTQLAVLTGQLREGGIGASAFGSAEAALAAMETCGPPGLIVTDLHMPGLDGRSFCRQLRSSECKTLGAVPILVVSAALPDDRPGGTAADIGGDAFLQCPVDGTELVAVVQSLLERKGDETEPPQDAQEQDRCRLEEERARLAAILEATQAGTWEWNVQTGETIFNERWAEILGYRLVELGSVNIDTWRTLCHPDDLELAEKQLARHFAGDVSYYSCDCRMRHKDGHWVWLRDCGKVVSRTADGRPLWMSGSHIDINDRKMTEEALRQSEGRLQTVLANSGIVVTVADRDLRYTWVSGQSSGRGLDAVIGKRDDEIAQHRTAEELLRIKREVIAAEHGVRTELPVPWQGGDIVYDVSAEPLRDASGKVTGVVTAASDITERRRNEQALEQRMVALTRPLDHPEGVTFGDLFNIEEIQRLQDQFAAATGVASIITHADGTPITRPSRFCRLCNDIIRNTEKGRTNCYRSDAALGRRNPDGPTVQPCLSGGLWDAGAAVSVGGRHIANWLIGQVRDETQTDAKMRAYAREIGADEEAVLEAFHEVPAMSRKRFEEVSQVLFTLANQLSNAAYQNVQQARFISDRDRAEEEREELRGKLAQAQKMEAIGRLAGGVAHDFNNMLSVILGHAEMALERIGPDEPFHADLAEIKHAAERSADLTRQLLAFARKQTVSPKVVDPNRAVAEMTSMLERLMGEDIDLAWRPGGGVWPIKVDPSQLDQVLANLCVNARDAIDGVGKVTIETANAAFDSDYCALNAGYLPGDYVMLAVSDDGCGMDEETAANVFEPFFTTKALGKGTGLGLATVYGVIKQNNGFINVYSELGQGTSFKIYLPRHIDETVLAQAQATDESAPHGHETILLVEDEPSILRMATVMLHMDGYTVVAANSPDEALRLAREWEGDIHLLLSDVVMPGMNGRDLVEEVLAIRPRLKCIFMSGYTANVIADHGVLEDSTYFIQKPFTRKKLLETVRQALSDEGEP